MPIDSFGSSVIILSESLVNETNGYKPHNPFCTIQTSLMAGIFEATNIFRGICITDKHFKRKGGYWKMANYFFKDTNADFLLNVEVPESGHIIYFEKDG